MTGKNRLVEKLLSIKMKTYGIFMRQLIKNLYFTKSMILLKDWESPKIGNNK